MTALQAFRFLETPSWEADARLLFPPMVRLFKVAHFLNFSVRKSGGCVGEACRK
jgi:hypothetical protein